MRQESGVRNSLRATRARLGLSQQELAEAAGVTRQTIGGIEGGLYAPSAAVALRLARALGCRVEELFWLDEELPRITAHLAGPLSADGETRVALARIGERWVAHPLRGEHAYRAEMVPCDGVGTPAGEPGRLQVRILDDPESLGRTAALAGCTPVLSLWARAAERWQPGLRVFWTFANSMAALRSLARGEVHAAGLHLYDPESGEFNTPFVRRVLGEEAVTLVNLGVWEEGLLVREGNPKSIRGAADLARPDVRVVNREPGAGSRLLLDQALAEAGAPPEEIAGYEDVAPGHWEVARAVASGEADTGVSTGAVAAAYGLGFLSLREVRYDLALRTEYLEQPPVRQLLGTLEHRWVRSQLALLGGYNTASTGAVVAETAGAA